MTWMLNNVPEDLQKLIREKQGIYAAEKGRAVSIPYTIYRLLKEAYLTKGEGQNQ